MSSCCERTPQFGSKPYGNHGAQVVALTRKTGGEFFITAQCLEGESAHGLFQRVAETVRDLRAHIVSLEVFGLPGRDAGRLRDALGNITWPVTWIEEGCERPNPVRGVQVWAVTGADVKPIVFDEAVTGSVFEIDGVQYCRLGGLVPPDPSRLRTEQTRAVFDRMLAALHVAGMDFGNVIRTWFYNDEMTQWYGGFNHVRTAFLKEHGVFDGLVPASTGIGGRNICGAALTAALFAVKAGRGAATAMAIPSPLQCPALDYGSSFSRAVELETGGLRRLFVSGAASIGIDGRSVHIGRVDAQVALTMDVVRAILDSRKMDWGKVTRAIAYFKHNKDAPAFDRYCTLQGIRDMPVLLANNDICRDDLLFEIEVDAVAET